MDVGFLSEAGHVPQLGVPFPICIFLKNTGRTPARDLRIRMNSDAVICDSREPTVPEFFDGDKPAELGALGPDVVYGHWIGNSRPIDPEPLSTGAKIFAVWGIVDYDDVFGIPHRTKFFIAKLGPSPTAPTAAVGPYNDCT